MEKLPYKINDIVAFKVHGKDAIGLNTGFQIIDYYAIFDYYPKNRFYEVDESILTIRKIVYAFKVGRVNNKDLTYHLVKFITAANIPLENAILIPIPASTSAKSKIRYENFCQILSEKLGIRNGYNLITTIDHEETKGKTGGNKIGHFRFNECPYSGLNIILLDDVRTSGTTFKQTAKRMLEYGAKSIIGIFIAKTVGNSQDVILRENQ